MTPTTGGLSRKMLAVAIAVVVIAASLTVVIAYSDERNSKVSALPTTSSSSSSSVSESSTSYSTVSSPPAECPGRQSSGFGFGFVTTGPTSPAVICVQLYYYNSVAPLTINLTSVLSIQAVQYIPNGSVDYPRSFNGASNFTITTSQTQLVIGGPTNENEGTTVAFAITYKAGASGIYELGLFSSSGLGAYMLGAQEPESCGAYGEILAGSSGLPNYAQEQVGCITFDTSSASIAIPGIPYQLIPGTYFQILGLTNSSGIEVLP